MTTPHAPQRTNVYTIRNLHDASRFIWREFATKVKLAVKLLWARMTAQRILKSIVKLISDTEWDYAATFERFTPSLPVSQNAQPNFEMVDGMLMPAAAVGATSTMKAIADKSIDKQARYAAATEKALAKVKQPRKGNFNKVKPKPNTPVLNSVYRDACKADAAMLASEAGI